MSLARRRDLELYVHRVYDFGLSPYKASLAGQRFCGIKRILDVGCGPGQWAIAAAELYTHALVIGVDTERTLLDHAVRFAREHHVNNCHFVAASYEDLLRLFPAGSFDLIMCHSVLQYVDESKAIQIFSALLRRGGMLLMHWNHGFGYYLSRFISHLLRHEYTQSIYPLRILFVEPLRRFFVGTISPDHFVTFGRLRRLAAKEDILLQRIPVEPLLDYQDGPWGISKVFSCRGIKKSAFHQSAAARASIKTRQSLSH